MHMMLPQQYPFRVYTQCTRHKVATARRLHTILEKYSKRILKREYAGGKSKLPTDVLPYSVRRQLNSRE